MPKLARALQPETGGVCGMKMGARFTTVLSAALSRVGSCVTTVVLDFGIPVWTDWQ